MESEGLYLNSNSRKIKKQKSTKRKVQGPQIYFSDYKKAFENNFKSEIQTFNDKRCPNFDFIHKFIELSSSKVDWKPEWDLFTKNKKKVDQAKAITKKFRVLQYLKELLSDDNIRNKNPPDIAFISHELGLKPDFCFKILDSVLKDIPINDFYIKASDLELFEQRIYDISKFQRELNILISNEVKEV